MSNSKQVMLLTILSIATGNDIIQFSFIEEEGNISTSNYAVSELRTEQGSLTKTARAVMHSHLGSPLEIKLVDNS